MSPKQTARSRAPVALALAAALLLLTGLGTPDLWAPDEPRYGQVAEEMRAGKRGAADLVLLRLGGEPYTQKPPLYFWLAAAAGTPAGGVGEWAARLPSALAGLATLAVWFSIARRLSPQPAVAWITGALLITTFRFVHFARRAQLDVLLALFEGTALWAWLAWREADTPRSRRRALVVLHGATALALLTKGPVGLLPWACFAVLTLADRKHGATFAWLPAWGAVLALAPVLVWIASAVALAPEGFFEVAVVENLFTRFAEGTDHARPIWYFVTQLPVEALPWSLLWPACAWYAWRNRSAKPDDEAMRFGRRVLAVWVAVPFVFFSLSAGKRGIYLLPALPALCLWAASTLDAWRRSGEAAARRWLDGAATPLLLCAVLAIAAALPWADFAARDGSGTATLSPAIVQTIETARRCGLIVAALGAPAALGVPLLARTPLGLRGASVAWGVVYAIWLCGFLVVLPGLDAEKSPRPVAEAAMRATRPGEPVGLLGQPALLGGLLFYGDGRGFGDDEPRVTLLSTTDQVLAFRRAGGRIVVVRGRDAGWLDAAGPWRVLETARSGRRAQQVVELEPGAPP